MVVISFIDKYFLLISTCAHINLIDVQFQLVNTYIIVTDKFHLSQMKLNGTDVMSDKTRVAAADEGSVIGVSRHTHQVVNG